MLSKRKSVLMKQACLERATGLRCRPKQIVRVCHWSAVSAIAANFMFYTVVQYFRDMYPGTFDDYAELVMQFGYAATIDISTPGKKNV